MLVALGRRKQRRRRGGVPMNLSHSGLPQSSVALVRSGLSWGRLCSFFKVSGVAESWGPESREEEDPWSSGRQWVPGGNPELTCQLLPHRLGALPSAAERGQIVVSVPLLCALQLPSHQEAWGTHSSWRSQAQKCLARSPQPWAKVYANEVAGQF